MSNDDFIADIPTQIELGVKFKDFDMRLYKAQGDGNCFFHSVLMGFVKSYRRRYDSEGRDISRRKFARDLRDQIANFLEKPHPKRSDITVYKSLSRGEIVNFSKACPEFTLENMQIKLRSNDAVGLEMVEPTSIALKVNIIIIDREKQDIYQTGDGDYLFDPSRPSSVVLLYGNGHFDLCGVGVETKTPFGTQTRIVSHFKNSNPFIEYLRSL